MHQLLSAQTAGQSLSSSYGGGGSGGLSTQSQVQLSDIISLSSFDIVKNLQMPVFIYIALIVIEIAYMILIPVQLAAFSQRYITTLLFNEITAVGVYIICICVALLVIVQTVFIFLHGRNIKMQQAKGQETQAHSQNHNHEHDDNKFTQSSELINFMLKFSGIFLTVLSTALYQFMLRVFLELIYCDRDFEMEYGCDTKIRTVATYFAIIGIILMTALIVYADMFINKQFPDVNIPWAAWNDRSRFLRNVWKIIQVISFEFTTTSYTDIINFVCLIINIYILYERYIKPSMYNRLVHISMVYLECQLFIFTFFGTIINVAAFTITLTGILYIAVIGLIIGTFLLFAIDRREQEIVAISTDLKNFKNQFQIELYVVVMLHELERLVLNEEYGQEKHIHAIISRHMEECINEACPCKNYEPEFDKKFTSIGSKRLTVTSFTMGGPGGSLNHLGSATSLNELKRLPYKITYKTKVEIFKQEFELRVDQFLEAYPKSYGIKLLKSFFNHRYCDSSYKALFVQLENSITCKNFKGKIFIYHLKTQIQDEMKRSLESPLTFDINQLLRFEKCKLDFEKYLEDLSYNCQTFWTDLNKEDYDVHKTLNTAYEVSERIIKIKSLFSKLIYINPLCIDTSSTYALAYRYILRDEATFTELVNRIQQIKNSSKLEQQREHGVRFFDSDIYSLLMVSGDVKDLGRIRQANSSCRFVFGYDPRDLIGSKINKLMPIPFAAIHDKFLNVFLSKGKSAFLERNQPLPVLTKDGYLQMTLFYVKPMVSLHFGLIFSTFAKILNKYKIGDDSLEFLKMNKLCIMLTDRDGYIHGMSEQCTKLMGMPPPTAKKQLSINDNQLFNIQQISPQLLQQDLELEVCKGCQSAVDTSFLNRERQFRREYPDIACKIGHYQAEIGVHKFQYRELNTEIYIFVIKLDDRDPVQFARLGIDFNDSLKSKSEQEELTYSEFSITTANSSVASSQVATSKFKTFKSKIQSMNMPSQIVRFQRISFLTFFLLLGIAAGNFAINLIQNHSFMTNLDLLNNLQILIQTVPESSHAVREILLISNGIVDSTDPGGVMHGIAANRSSVKFQFYKELLASSSDAFEHIQNQLKTTLVDKVSFDEHRISVNDVQTDGDIKILKQSMQTSLNLFSSKIQKLSTHRSEKFVDVIVPHISFQWTQMTKEQKNNLTISDMQQEVYFIIQNGLGSIVKGLEELRSETGDQIIYQSQQSAIIAIVLAAVSIFLVIVLLPTSWPTLTHIEKITYLILMSLNRLPEAFCVNETKACMEIIMFLNEQKDGEKSTHQMIKKHEHRKQNRQLLKLPKSMKVRGSSSSSDESASSDYDKSSMIIKSKRGQSNFDADSASTDSRASKNSSHNTQSVTSSKITSLAKVRAAQSQYVSQQVSQAQRIKRGEGGSIDLDLAHAKTSELLDDNDDLEVHEELSEAELAQKERENLRKVSIHKILRRKKIKKFAFLILTAFFIAIYFGITSYYLNLVHQYERLYSSQYQLISNRIHCYSKLTAYVVDTLARNEYIDLQGTDQSNAASFYISECYQSEKDYNQLMLDGMTSYKAVKNFIDLNSQFDGDQICQTLQDKKQMDYYQCQNVLDGILVKGLTESLQHFIRNIQSVMLFFDAAKSLHSIDEEILELKAIFKRWQLNDLLSVHEVYFKTAFTYLREESLQIIQSFFDEMNSYYNMLFGLFVGFLTIFQSVVVMYLVKKLSKEITKMYHVVLLVPFSGRTQNDLNRLMMIKL